MNGIAKWLKDKEDNILIPHTLTSAVFNSEGKSVDELLANSSSSIVIDSELSKESENPVQNKVITENINNIITSIQQSSWQITSFILEKNAIVSTGLNISEQQYEHTRVRFQLPIYLEKGEYLFLSSKLTHCMMFKYPSRNITEIENPPSREWIPFENKIKINNSGWYRFSFKSGEEGTELIDLEIVDLLLFKLSNCETSDIIIDTELSKTSENPVQNKVITEKLEEVFQSVSDGKSKLAAAITGLGVETAADATFEEMVENINSIIFPNSMNFISSDDAITGIAEYTTAYGFIPPNEAIVGTTSYSVETIVINDTIYGLANYL